LRFQKRSRTYRSSTSGIKTYYHSNAAAARAFFLLLGKMQEQKRFIHHERVTTGKEMFKKVDSFTKKHQLSRTQCVFVRADCASAMIRTKKAL